MQLTLNQKIKFLRETLKKEQHDFAEVLKLSQPGYSSLERGRTQFKLNQIDALSEHFGISKEYLLCNDDIEKGYCTIWDSDGHPNVIENVIVKRTPFNADFFKELDSIFVPKTVKTKIMEKFNKTEISKPKWVDEFMDLVAKKDEQIAWLQNHVNQLMNQLGKPEGKSILAMHVSKSENKSELKKVA